MIASGRNAPRHVNDWLRRVDTLDDRSLFEEMQAFGGIPKGLSFAMARQFLTVIRHDQAMFRDYEPGKTRIKVPILALAGRDDDMTDEAALADWADYTTGQVSVEWLEGRHYFLLDQAEGVALRIEAFAGRIDDSSAATSGR
jgi:surfactin synthase thioesterase subunit